MNGVNGKNIRGVGSTTVETEPHDAPKAPLYDRANASPGAHSCAKLIQDRSQKLAKPQLHFLSSDELELLLRQNAVLVQYETLDDDIPTGGVL